MLLSEAITLRCGLELPNRLAKAAMAENIAPKHNLNEEFPTLYGQWAGGRWGLIITGNVQVSSTYLGSPADLQVPVKSVAQSQQELWKTWAATCRRAGTPTIVQLCHPGRQSPTGAGDRSFSMKNVAPSPIKLNFGDNLIARSAVSLMFGTPRELTADEITGPGGIIEQFVEGAKQAFVAGFDGVQLHGSHGYLLSQFMSSQTNKRTDDFGGTATKRVEVVLRIIRETRAQTSPEFCIGIKLNSVDAATSDSVGDVLEQIKLIDECGIDFIEISGGTYENPRMIQDDRDTTEPEAKQSTVQRESFFLEFAQIVRARFPKIVLMVTGGFRTRLGMEAALQSGGCDIIGIGRPAAILPKLPAEIILNTELTDQQATMKMKTIKIPWWAAMLPIRPLGASAKTAIYNKQIARMGKGLQPVDLRVKSTA